MCERMTEEEDNEDEQDKDLDFANFYSQLKLLYNKLDIRDLIIITLLLLMFIMYILHTREIDKCITFYQEILKPVVPSYSYC